MAKLTSALKKTSIGGGDKQQSGEFITAPDTLKLGKKKEADADSAGNAAGSFKLFHHFDSYKRDYSTSEKFLIDNPSVHPAFIKLGIQYAHERISGSNARCLAFLNAFRQFIESYRAPTKENKTISKDLESKLKPNIKYQNIFYNFLKHY